MIMYDSTWPSHSSVYITSRLLAHVHGLHSTHNDGHYPIIVWYKTTIVGAVIVAIKSVGHDELMSISEVVIQVSFPYDLNFCH
jgi:hypothetical protein